MHSFEKHHDNTDWNVYIVLISSMQHICSNSREIHCLRRVNSATKRNSRLDYSILKVFVLLLLKQWIQMTVGYCVKIIIFSHPHGPIAIAKVTAVSANSFIQVIAGMTLTVSVAM